MLPSVVRESLTLFPIVSAFQKGLRIPCFHRVSQFIILSHPWCLEWIHLTGSLSMHKPELIPNQYSPDMNY